MNLSTGTTTLAVQFVELVANAAQYSLDMRFDHILEHFKAPGSLRDLIAQRFK